MSVGPISLAIRNEISGDIPKATSISRKMKRGAKALDMNVK
jgi:hypothetical protein